MGAFMELSFDSGNSGGGGRPSKGFETNYEGNSRYSAWNATAEEVSNVISKKTKRENNNNAFDMVEAKADRVTNTVNRVRLKVLKVLDSIGMGVGLAVTGIARDYINVLFGHWKDDATDPTHSLPFPLNSALFRAFTPFTSSTAPVAGTAVSAVQRGAHSRAG